MSDWKKMLVPLVLVALLAVSCKPKALLKRFKTAATSAATARVFDGKGVVKELPTDGKSVVIQHEAIASYMPAMTMPFEVHDLKELHNLHVGDVVTFKLKVTDKEGWIEQIVVTQAAPSDTTNAMAAPAGMSFHQVRDVDPLNVGDPLPEYHFTNELGQAISTKQFKGQAFAFTFFFTRCPYPTFCPLMSRNFEGAQAVLLAQANAPTNWHLFSISFDTTGDSPDTLKAYAAQYHYEPAHWSFLTGDLLEVTAIGDQVGEYFGHDETGGITHNLRTVVVDAAGRIDKVFNGNAWTSEELAVEIVKAAGKS